MRCEIQNVIKKTDKIAVKKLIAKLSFTDLTALTLSQLYRLEYCTVKMNNITELLNIQVLFIYYEYFYNRKVAESLKLFESFSCYVLVLQPT